MALSWRRAMEESWLGRWRRAGPCIYLARTSLKPPGPPRRLLWQCTKPVRKCGSPGGPALSSAANRAALEYTAVSRPEGQWQRGAPHPWWPATAACSGSLYRGRCSAAGALAQLQQSKETQRLQMKESSRNNRAAPSWQQLPRRLPAAAAVPWKRRHRSSSQQSSNSSKTAWGCKWHLGR